LLRATTLFVLRKDSITSASASSSVAELARRFIMAVRLSSSGDLGAFSTAGGNESVPGLLAASCGAEALVPSSSGRLGIWSARVSLFSILKDITILLTLDVL